MFKPLTAAAVAVTLCCATHASAGSIQQATMDPVVIATDTQQSSSSGEAFVMLWALVVFAAAASN